MSGNVGNQVGLMLNKVVKFINSLRTSPNQKYLVIKLDNNNWKSLQVIKTITRKRTEIIC
jgi:hypothetical protein